MTKTTVPSANGASVAPLKPTSAWEPTDAERAAIQAQGLNINATNMVEAIDRDWIKVGCYRVLTLCSNLECRL